MTARLSSTLPALPARPAAAGRPRAASAGSSALEWSARLWFVVAGAGQLIFLGYIVVLYGSAALGQDPAAWNKVMPKGHVPGDTIGNFAVAMHVLLAAIITGGGLLQLIPQVRRHAPALHRWNGRIYTVTAFAISLGGLYMVWVRGSVTGGLAISLNALLIMYFAVMVWRYALQRKFGAHRRWALRLFLAASGVWFIRIGIMGWIVVNGRPVGFDPETFTGPFITFWSYASFLLPLAVLELYLWTESRGGARGKVVMAAAMAVLTVATAIGIFGATAGMWLPAL